jgi:hypothetical protein
MAPARENSERGSFHDKEHHSKRPRAHDPEESVQLIFTVSSATGTVLRIEKVDSQGKRREVPEEEAVALAGEHGLHEIDAALDDAFEAGIASVLAPGSIDDTNGVSDEEIELRRELLAGIIEQGTRRRLRRRLVERLILSRALAH